jgi:cysteine-rich repeat protein
MHDRSGFTLVLAVAAGLVLSTLPASAKKPTRSACTGRYLVGGGKAPLIEGAGTPDVDVVVVSASGVRIGSGCGLAPARMSPLRNGWKVRAEWPVCGGFRKVRLEATISADCNLLRGRLKAKTARMRKSFAATMSRCGDGTVDAEMGEHCEPPNTSTCNADCQRLYPRCGDGVVDPEEECDDGNLVDGDGCNNCELPRCGNGVRDPGEECDDGNVVDGDGCSSDCRVTCEGQRTFETIQNRIFTPSCSLATCHGPFTQGNLNLQVGAAYASLVGVPADNLVAHAAGKIRVVPGDPDASFLSEKLHGTLVDGEGTRMPGIGPALSDTEIALIDAWIRSGADPTGTAPGAPCLPALEYTPTTQPPPPPGGYQIVLDGPTLQPGQEQEGCLWIPTPNPRDFYVSKFEIALNPGTHHFSIFPYLGSGAPQTGVWQVNNFGCFNGSNLGGNVTGAPQAPYFVDAYPPGIARLLKAGAYLGLNAHYRNDFSVPIQIKVWTNVYPYVGTPAHIADTLIDLSSTFSIYVPPFTQGVQHGHYVNETGKPLSFLGLSGHMHFRGLRFTAWLSNGTKIYENFDWAHPGGRGFDPPYVLAPGDYVDYECLYDNGVERTVRHDFAGNPVALVFGVTTEDAMCILTGSFY